MQSTNTILMIRPAKFYMNEQTAVNNYYQCLQDAGSDMTASAHTEFDGFVSVLRAAGVKVIVYQDTDQFDTPDALFPNNWVSFHPKGLAVVYPMFAENRRLERSDEVFNFIEEKGVEINQIIDYTSGENEGCFLEGTGSIVLDRVHRKAYCGLSPRTEESLVIEFCEDLEYLPILFTANQTIAGKRLPIYHTNVMMSVASEFAMVCLDSIDDKKEQKNLVKHLKEDDKPIIKLSEKQIANFAANALEVIGANGQKYLAMSTSGYKNLAANQIKTIEEYVQILHTPLDTIERLGGGGARCMIAEIYL